MCSLPNDSFLFANMDDSMQSLSSSDSASSASSASLSDNYLTINEVNHYTQVILLLSVIYFCFFPFIE